MNGTTPLIEAATQTARYSLPRTATATEQGKAEQFRVDQHDSLKRVTRQREKKKKKKRTCPPILHTSKTARPTPRAYAHATLPLFMHHHHLDNESSNKREGKGGEKAQQKNMPAEGKGAGHALSVN